MLDFAFIDAFSKIEFLPPAKFENTFIMGIKDDILEKGLGLLDAVNVHNEAIDHWLTFLKKNPSNWQYKDDPYVWFSCIQALIALTQGNYGIGCILVDPHGQIIVHGHNQSFIPRYRTDLHAEMVVLNEWEKMREKSVAHENYTLFSSLEPCPMCLTRLITSDIKIIKYVAPDPAGGMVQRIDQLPPIHLEFAQRHQFSQATCVTELKDAATQILHINMHDLNDSFR